MRASPRHQATWIAPPRARSRHWSAQHLAPLWLLALVLWTLGVVPIARAAPPSDSNPSTNTDTNTADNSDKVDDQAVIRESPPLDAGTGAEEGGDGAEAAASEEAASAAVQDSPPPGDERDPSTTENAAAPGSPSRPGDPALIACDAISADDELGPVMSSLALLRPAGFEIRACSMELGAFRQRALRVALESKLGSGGDPQEARHQSAYHLMLYVLQLLAEDGFTVGLAVRDRGSLEALIQPTRTIEKGVAFFEIKGVEVVGQYLPDDDAGRITRLMGNLQTPEVFPDDVRARFAILGYRVTTSAKGPGLLTHTISPGRLLRRVRIHGARPIPVREIQRSLSIEGRPGAIAHGLCSEPAALRKNDNLPMCGLDDLECREWEKREVDRIERYLFDAGYLGAKARLGLRCGRAPEEADLEVYLDKGTAYKIARGYPRISGANPEDRPWLARTFTPRTLLLFRRRITREFMEKAKSRATKVYSEPGLDGRVLRGSNGQTYYPQADIRSSYEDLDFTRRDEISESTEYQMKIKVDLGRGLETAFIPERTRAKGRRRDGLDFSRRELNSALQIFQRHESPTNATAQREAENLRAFYQSKGYLLARVRGRYDDFGSMQKLVFSIEEGPRTRIVDLDLQLPDGLTPEVERGIRRKFKAAAALRRRGSFSEASALGDIALLTSAFNDAGYLCSAVSIDLGFWPDGVTEDGAHASFDARRLVEAQGAPFWLSQLDPAGAQRLREEANLPLYVRIRVQRGPRVLSSKKETIRYLSRPLDATSDITEAETRDTASAWSARRILANGLLRRDGDADTPGNVPLNTDTSRKVREEIRSNYRRNGFPIAEAEVTWEYRRPRAASTTDISLSGVDDAEEEDDGTGTEGTALAPVAAPDQVLAFSDLRDIGDSSIGVCVDHAAEAVAFVDPVIHVYEGERGVFGQTRLRGNFKTRSRVVQRELRFERDEDYSAASVENSVAQLQDLGVARGVQVTPYPVDCETSARDGTDASPAARASEDEQRNQRCVVHHVVSMEEAKDVTAEVQYGIGLATLNPFYAFLRPKFPNIFGSAIDFSLDGLFGFDLSEALDGTTLCAGQRCYERSIRGALGRRHIFGSKLNAELSGGYQVRVTPARGRIDTAYGNLRFNRSFKTKRAEKPEWNLYFGYLIQVANLAKDVLEPLGGTTDAWINRTEGVVQARSGLLESGVVWAHVDNAFNPTEGFIASTEFRLASPWLGGEDWWARADLNWQHFIPIKGFAGERLGFRYNLTYGHAIPFAGPGARSPWVPEVWRYYGGGTADLGLRGILPETMLLDVEEVELPFGGTIYRARAQGGLIRALGTVAFQVISVKDFLGGKLAHSVFYDFGVISRGWNSVKFPRDYRHSIGVNVLKWDIRIVTLALGYAWLVPGKTNVGPTDDRNGRFVFDVGITF